MPRKKATVLKAVDNDQELESFREKARRFIEIKDLMKILKLESSDLRDPIVSHIKSHGEGDPEKKVVLRDSGVKWQWSMITSESLDEDAAVAVLQELIAKCPRSKKQTALKSMLSMRPTIDQDAYDKCKVLGEVPQELIDAYEVSKSYEKLNHWLESKVECKGCRAIIHRTHKFCHECGTPQE